MIVGIDLAKPVEACTDPALLESLLNALVGQRCYKVDLSHGNELMLHVGDPIPYHHRKLAEEQKGSWILGTRASSWQILLNNPPGLIQSGDFPSECAFGHPISGEDAEHHAKQVAGKTILDIHPFRRHLQAPVGVGIGLAIDFDGGPRLVIVPSEEPDLDEKPVADWELFTPFRMYLRVGPGMVWSYLRADLPVKPTV